MRQLNSTGQSACLKDFKQLALLGEGAYSTVFKVLRLSDQNIYSLKKVKLPSLSEKEKQNSLNEVRLLASVGHENVIGYKEAFLDEASGCLCIVTEFADGGDLYQKITQHQKLRTFFRESDVWHCVFGMVHGLKALHDMKILHRDMKCANVFLGLKGEVKLGDFNVSKVAKRGLCMTQTGTPYYASPEVWRDMPYDAKSDMWSLGCILYEMVALRPPFRADDMEALYRKVLKGQYPRIPSVYSRDVTESISILLQVNPRQRPNVDQFLASPVMQRHANYDCHGRSGKVPQASDLLQTIKLPKNFMDAENLSICLPKPRYEIAVDQQSGASNGDAAAGTEVQSQRGSRQPNHAPPIEERRPLDENRLKDALDSLLYDNENPKKQAHGAEGRENVRGGAGDRAGYDESSSKHRDGTNWQAGAPPPPPRHHHQSDGGPHQDGASGAVGVGGQKYGGGHLLPNVIQNPGQGIAPSSRDRGGNIHSSSHISGVNVNPTSRGSSHVHDNVAARRGPPSSLGQKAAPHSYVGRLDVNGRYEHEGGHNGSNVASHQASNSRDRYEQPNSGAAYGGGRYQAPHDHRYPPSTGGRYEVRHDIERYYGTRDGNRQQPGLDYRQGGYDQQSRLPYKNEYYYPQRQAPPPIDRQVAVRRQLAVAGGAVARNKRPDQNRQYYRQQQPPTGQNRRISHPQAAGNYRAHADRPIRVY